MTPATILALEGRVTLMASPIPMPRSGAPSVPTEGGRSAVTSGSAPEHRTPMMRTTALTTVITPGCRSTVELRIRHGQIIQTARGTTLTGLSTSWIFTVRACQCAFDEALSARVENRRRTGDFGL